MIEIRGDYWQSGDWFAQVCTTNTTLKSNGELVMGAGIAKDFATRIPILPRLWGNKVKSGHKSVIITDWCGADGNYAPISIALPTKYDWKLPSPEWLVIQSCKEMLYLVNCLARLEDGNGKIIMTRPGCGNGGLKWENIKPKLDFLDDRFTVISND